MLSLTHSSLRRTMPGSATSRQAQGQARAKAAGLYKDRAEDVERNAGIAARIHAGASWTSIQNATGCSRVTIALQRGPMTPHLQMISPHD